MERTILYFNKLLNGSYKLKDFRGNIMKTSINGKILEKYYDR